MSQAGSSFAVSRHASLVGTGLAMCLLAVQSFSSPRDRTSVPTSQAIGPPSRLAPDCETIEFSLAETGKIVIGSLGEAGVVFPIVMEGGAPLLVRLPQPSLSEADPTAVSQSIVTPDQPSFRLASWRSSNATLAVSLSRLFFVQIGSNPALESSYQPISTCLAAESPRVRIWREVTSDGSVPSDAEETRLTELLQSLDIEVLPRIVELYGEIADLDGDGKLSLCLTSKLRQLPADGSPVEGLTQVNDFQLDLPRPFSNHADVLFISEALRAGPHARTILTHEAAHLAVFSRRREHDPDQLAPEDDWLQEGYAHFAEWKCAAGWSNLRGRIHAFHQEPALSPLVVVDAQRQGLWRQPGSRAAAWLFLRWLAEEYGEEAVAAAARDPAVGCKKIAQWTGEPWPELFRRWSVSIWQKPAEIPAHTTTFSFNGLNRSEFGLRGSAHQAVQMLPTSTICKITAPRAAKLQVTLIEDSHAQPMIRIIR